MRVRTLVLAVGCLAVAPVGASDRVAVHASPRVAFAPADLNVMATIETSVDNRAIEIVAESEQFYRSSEIPLEGDRSARTAFVQFRALPSGTYVVRAVVRGTDGRPLATSATAVNIVGR
jgi:hypothetical protein